MDGYLTAAESAVGLLADPAVAAAWDRPSALAEFRVGGLAGHLAQQVFSVAEALAAAGPDTGAIRLLDHYARSAWLASGVDSEINQAIRRLGDERAADGPAALHAQVSAALAALTVELPALPADRVVRLPWAGWSLTLADFLQTRLMEIVVHSDDLAVSVGVATPALPAEVTDPVLHLLAALSARRHGATAVLRGLSRAERAPASISAF